MTCWCFLYKSQSCAGHWAKNQKVMLIQKRSSSNSTGSRSFTGPLRIQTPDSNSEPSNIAARCQDAWNVAPGRRMDDGPARHLQRPHVGPCWPFKEIRSIKSHNGLKNSKNSCIQNPEKLKQMKVSEVLLLIHSPLSLACHYPLTKASPCGSCASDQGILHRVHVPRSSTLNQSSFHASGDTLKLSERKVTNGNMTQIDTNHSWPLKCCS